MKRRAIIPYLLLCCGLVRADLPVGDRVPSGLGVNIHFTDETPGELAQIAAAGFRIVRMDLTWEQVEQKPRDYDFHAYDRLMLGLKQYRLRPIFILNYGNPLYDDGNAPHTPQGRKAFADFAAAAARHFRDDGVIWEIWNEPNLGQFWKPQPNPADYAALADEVIRAIREQDADALVIGPAVSGVDLPFLTACAESGLLGRLSAISIHPYRRGGPETAVDDYRQARAILRRLAKRPGVEGAAAGVPTAGNVTQPPLVCGEWGYSTAWPGIDPRKQAAYWARQTLVNLSQGVPISIWYDWRDDGDDPANPEHRFGLVEHTPTGDPAAPFTPKPAYLAARTLSQMLDGMRFGTRLATEFEMDWVLLFRSDPNVCVVAWTTSPYPRRIGFPASDGEFGIFNLLGEQIARETARNGELWVDVTAEPVYVRPVRPNDALRLAAAWEASPMETVFASDSLNDKAKWSSQFTNPLDRAVNALVTLEPPAADAIESTHRAVKPGESVRFELNLPATRTASVQEPVVYLSLIEHPVPIARRAGLVCETAIDVQIRPITRSTAELIVTSPSAWKGDLSVDCEVEPGQDVRGSAIELTAAQPSFRHVLELIDPIPNKAHVRVTLSDASGPAPAVQQRFDDIMLSRDSWQISATQDGKPAGEAAVKVVDAPAGLPARSKAAEITYSGPAGAQVALNATGLAPSGDEGDILSFWLKGDGSGNPTRIRLSDAADQVFQIDGPRLNSTEWQYVQIPLTSTHAANWGGNRSGIMQPKLSIDTLLLIDLGTAAEGTVFVAGPSLIER